MKFSRNLYIGGEYVETKQYEDVLNPANEAVIGEAPVGDLTHAELAIAAAREAFDKGPWPRLSQRERQAKLFEFLDAIDRRKAEIVDLIVKEAGATLLLAEYVQYNFGMQHARHLVEISSRPAVETLPVTTTPNGMGGTVLGVGVMARDPVGVVSAITPYNFPFMLNVGKIFPAMAVGCAVVLKPSPYTPYEALILGEIAKEVGLPKGVLNVVTGGVEVGEKLTSDARVDLVTFTGSDKVGAAIQAQSAPTLKRLLLELGGKSAMIVRADADLQLAATNGLGGIVTHCGQGCALFTRHLVHNSVKERYLELLLGMMNAVKIGDPADPATVVGPLIREVARKRTEDYVEIARAEGGRLRTGGKRPEGFKKGFFFEPTLFDGVDNSARIAREEVFGPIGVVIGFDTDEEAIAISNDSDFGLSGSIISADVGRAYEMALQLRTGGVVLNEGPGTMSSHVPFGGIKRSGYGREYGYVGLNEFTNIKTVLFRGA
jgi:acyl-CoA reductase-like NAD-dependent aldehyde dehydrogenase